VKEIVDGCLYDIIIKIKEEIVIKLEEKFKRKLLPLSVSRDKII